MPNAALIAGKQTVIQGLEGGYDAFSDTSHRLQTRTGTAPLESGAQITDHAVAQPIELTLSGVVSDLTVNGQGRAREAWGTILKNWKEVETFSVVTPWVVYPQMIIQELTAPESGFGFNFTLKLVEIQLVGQDDVVPSFQALAPAINRQPLQQFGTVANISPLNFDLAQQEFNDSPPLKASNNPLDWLKRTNEKVNNFIGALADNDLINRAREINDVFGTGILSKVTDMSGLNSFLEDLDSEVASGNYTRMQADEAIDQIGRAKDLITETVNDLNSRRKHDLNNFVDINYDPNATPFAGVA